jgi:hypothetical protein
MRKALWFLHDRLGVNNEIEQAMPCTAPDRSQQATWFLQISPAQIMHVCRQLRPGPDLPISGLVSQFRNMVNMPQLHFSLWRSKLASDTKNCISILRIAFSL